MAEPASWWRASKTDAEALAALKEAIVAHKVELPADPLLEAELLSLRVRWLPEDRLDVYTANGARPSRALAVAKVVLALKASP